MTGNRRRAYPTHRRLLLVTVAIAVFGVPFTLDYIYPMNEVLMGLPGHKVDADKMRSLVRRWVIADQIRFAAMSMGFLFLLRAFAIPIPSKKLSIAG